MTRPHALVTGAHGIVGLNLVEELGQHREWALTALGRRRSPPAASLDYLSVDLNDAEATRSCLAHLGGVTHLFFAAFQYARDPLEEIAVNTAILANTLDALRAAGAPLERVLIYQGAKAYGAMMGGMRSPAKESDPRVPGPLFYYDQEDLLNARGAREGFATTVMRPDFIAGVGLGGYANLVSTVAVYGSLCKASGLPMYFPGGAAAFEALIQITDARLLARGSIWAATRTGAHDELFNITNGDLFRWSRAWPRIAAYFGTPPGHPLNVDLKMFVKEKHGLWAGLKRRHGLLLDLDDLLDWNQAGVLSQTAEVHSSTIRIRQAGFHECLDTEDRLVELFDELRARRYIP